MRCWVLTAGPIALTDSRNAAIANAIENDLVPASVH
jgi:hypothetical protein